MKEEMEYRRDLGCHCIGEEVVLSWIIFIRELRLAR
jgi:hypothetical protein